ncbi:MAG: DUF4783 domain-containing protein, partial [Ignavibacteria bacterium]|nr:DUF4783 domain-containing protein [Ignavibacteria bacterium]
MRPNGLKSSNYLFFIIFAVSMFLSFASSAQKAPEEEWLQHLVKGDAKKLASFMGAAVAVDLPSQSGTYSKSQTVMVLADFFGIYPA